MLEWLLKGILFLLALPVCIMLYSKKLFLGFLNWLDSYIDPCITMPFCFLFIHFMFSRLGFQKELITKDSWVFCVILIFIMMTLITIFSTIEKMSEHISRKVSLSKLIANVFLTLFSLSLMYCIMYYCIYDLYPETFKGVSESNTVVVLFDFFFYSFSIITTIGGTELIPTSVLSKVLVLLEMLTAFLFLIILIANYENVGKSYKNYLKELSNKRKQRGSK